jgi:hypothetical protein
MEIQRDRVMERQRDRKAQKWRDGEIENGKKERQRYGQTG